MDKNRTPRLSTRSSTGRSRSTGRTRLTFPIQSLLNRDGDDVRAGGVLDIQQDGGLAAVLSDAVGSFLGILDRLLIDLGDDVAGAQAGLFRGGSRSHGDDDGSVDVLGKAE